MPGLFLFSRRGLTGNYDPIDKITTIAGQVYTLSYGYNDVGRLTTITYPSGRIVRYHYNSTGQVASITTQAYPGATEVTLLNYISYLPFGSNSTFLYGNNLQNIRSYDLDYKLQGYFMGASTTLFHKAYIYDANANIEMILDNDDPTFNAFFSYDELDRLTGNYKHYGQYYFQYDEVGNRELRVEIVNDAVTYDAYFYSDSANQIDFIARNIDDELTFRGLIHDANGNIEYDNNNFADQSLIAYHYNQANRVDAATKDGLTTFYTYNALGQRTQKSSDTTNLHYHYDEAGQLIAITEPNGTTVQEFIYFGGPVALINANPAPLSDEIYFIHNDHLATPQFLTNMSQQVVWQVTKQTPFGITEVDEDPDGDGISIEFNLRFPGMIFDKETGTNYNYFRTNDPSLGRYLQSDPIGLKGGVSTYGYGMQNPLRYTDPYGLCVWDACIVETGLAIAAASAVTGACIATDCHKKIPEAIMPMAGRQTFPNPISHDREDDILYGDPLGCDEIEAALRDLKRTIDWRKGDLNPAERGLRVFVGHQQRIRKLQQRLDELKRKARDWGCNDDPECE